MLGVGAGRSRKEETPGGGSLLSSLLFLSLLASKVLLPKAPWSQMRKGKGERGRIPGRVTIPEGRFYMRNIDEFTTNLYMHIHRNTHT